MNHPETFPARNALPIVIGSALLIQLVGRYHAHEFTIGHFYYGWVVLRIAIPLVIIHRLGAPFAKIGLGLPADTRFLRLLGVITPVGLGAVYLILKFSPEYLGHYAAVFGGSSGARLVNFTVFTLSTLPGWEFLHRGFLLMGTAYFLQKNDGLEPAASHRSAVMMVWVFEVMFHLVKPPMEAFGMLLGSPLLSYVTIRTGSIWPAAAIHLGVETVFILAVM